MMLRFDSFDGERLGNEKALSMLPDMVDGFALSVLDSSPDCIKLLEIDGRLSFMNRNGMTEMEIEAFDAVADKRWPELWPAESRDMIERAIGEAAAGRSSVFEAFCPTAKGSPRWWSVTVAPILSGDGRARRILATSRDVTGLVEARRAAEAAEARLAEANARLAAELAEKSRLLEVRELLLAEIDHRVKNSFALISGILRLQMRSTDVPEARGAIQDAANRISTLSKLHEQLHFGPHDRDVALAPYLTSLVQGLTETLSSDEDVSVEADIRTEAFLGAAEAVSIGLVAAELVANALKHPRAGEANHVRVSFRHEAGRGAELTVSDTGVGLPDGFEIGASEGIGMKICRVYAAQLGGSIEGSNRTPFGAEFRVRFDL